MNAEASDAKNIAAPIRSCTSPRRPSGVFCFAAIENARRIIALADEHGSFKAWLDAHHPLPKDDWVRLFKRNFRFTGGEITGEFLMSSGYLPGAHRADCPVYAEIARLTPPWMAALL